VPEKHILIDYGVFGQALIKESFKSDSLSLFQNSIAKNQVVKITYNPIHKNKIKQEASTEAPYSFHL
jgi:hypothetical protein